MQTLSERPSVISRAPMMAGGAQTAPERCTGLRSIEGDMLRVFGKDQEIFSEGAVADFFYQVVRGAVRTVKLMGDGRRHIDAFHLSGDLFGIEGCDDYRFSAEAIGEVIVRVYRRRDLRKLIASEPQTAFTLMNAMAKTLERAQAHMLLLGRKCAREKIASFLLGFADRIAGERRITLPMSRMDIADHLGLTIETVSRTLKQLQRDAVIDLPSNRVIVVRNPAMLRHLDAGDMSAKGHAPLLLS